MDIHQHKKSINVSILQLIFDVTFVETEGYFSVPYLQVETSSMEDKDMFLLEFPKSSPSKLSNATQKESESHEKGQEISSTPQIATTVRKIAQTCPILDVGTTEKELEPIATKPLQVFSTRRVTEPRPMQVQTFEPTLGNEVHNYSAPLDLHDDVDLPIAIRKGTRKCMQHLLSNFVSFEKFSPSHKAFLT